MCDRIFFAFASIWHIYTFAIFILPGERFIHSMSIFLLGIFERHCKCMCAFVCDMGERESKTDREMILCDENRNTREMSHNNNKSC